MLPVYGKFTFKDTVTAPNGSISGGSFDKAVSAPEGSISGGSFKIAPDSSLLAAECAFACAETEEGSGVFTKAADSNGYYTIAKAAAYLDEDAVKENNESNYFLNIPDAIAARRDDSSVVKLIKMNPEPTTAENAAQYTLQPGETLTVQSAEGTAVALSNYLAVSAPAGYTVVVPPSGEETATSASVSYQLTLNAPTISGTATATYGTPVTLTANTDAASVSTISYEWYKDGTVIDGATEATYTMQNVADSGSYTVKISDGYTEDGSPASSATTVTISRAALTVTAGDTSGVKGNIPSAESTGITIEGTKYEDSISAADYFVVTIDSSKVTAASETGEYSNAVTVNYRNSENGKETFENAQGNYTVDSFVSGTYTVAASAAHIDYSVVGGEYSSIYFRTLAEAVADTTHAGWIKLDADNSEKLTIGRSVTVSLNGNTIDASDYTFGEGGAIQLAAGELTATRQETITAEKAVVTGLTEANKDKISLTSQNDTSGAYVGKAVKNESDGTYNYVVNPAVAKIGDTYYATLAEAFSAATDAQTVILVADSTLTDAVTVSDNKSVTLDLNGKTLTGDNSGKRLVVAAGAGLTLTDSAATKGAFVSGAEGSSVLVKVQGAFTLDGAIIKDTVYGIGSFGNGTITINSGSVTAKYYAVSTNGNVVSKAAITVSGGTLTSTEDSAVYLPSGTLTVSGATITGATGIYIKGGSATITGGTISGTGAAAEYTYSAGGSNPTGDAIVVDNCGYPSGAPTLTISGGAISSTTGKAVAAYTGNGVTELAEVTATVNTLSVPEGSYWGDKTTEGVYTLIRPVAQLGEGTSASYYSTVQAAIDAVGTTAATVKMLADSKENVTVASGKTVTLDLNDHVLTGMGNSSVINNLGTLTITDSAEAGTTRYWVADSTTGVWTLNADQTAENNANCSCTTTGGVITGGVGYNSSEYGGGIWNDSSLTMTGGNIVGNTAGTGGGVFISNNGSFTMTGGNIVGNTAGTGGGVAAKGASVTLSGAASITSNTATSYGGGLDFNSNDADVTLTIGDSVSITGNTSGTGTNTKADNLYLEKGIIDIGTDENVPTENMSIGVTTETAPTAGDSVAVTGTNDADYSGRFFSDSDSYVIYDDSNTVKLAAAVAQIVIGTGDTVTTTQYMTVQAAIDAATGDSETPAKSTTTVRMLTNATENITVPAGKNITLDLNDKVLTGENSTTVSTCETAYASVITVDAAGTLTITDSAKSKTTRYWTADSTTGLWTLAADQSTATANTTTGGIITGGTGRYYSYMSNSSLTGGGVSVFGNLVLQGGSIVGNSVDSTKTSHGAFGGGVKVETGATFTMEGGSILGNCSIPKLSPIPADGGGVYVAYGAAFTMTGGSIVSNRAKAGGGVNVANGAAFTMTDTASITGNTADDGGGVNVDNGGNFTMTDGSIVSNQAMTGGGVYDSGNMFLGGSATITGNTKSTDNTSNNLYLDDTTVTLGTGENGNEVAAPVPETNGMNVGVTLSGSAGVFTAADENAASYIACFTSDAGYPVSAVGNQLAIGAATITTGSKVAYYPTVQAAVNAVADLESGVEATAENATTITMIADSTESNGVQVRGSTLDNWKNVILDLNGHVLNLNNSGNIACYGSPLTITDSSPDAKHFYTVGDDGCWTWDDSTTENAVDFANLTDAPKAGTVVKLCGGAITGGYDDSSGGVYVNAAQLTMTGGNIVGNKAGLCGGGVALIEDGAFIMTGGNIVGNTAPYGGGVFIGGVIDGVTNPFTMTGGTISYNTATESGGGVYDENSGTIDVPTLVGGSARIINNYLVTDGTAKPNNLCLIDNRTITVGTDAAAPVTGGNSAMSIGVTTETAPTAGYPVAITGSNSADYASCFTSDNSSYLVTNEENIVKLMCGVARLTIGEGEKAKTVTYPTVQEAIDAAPGNEKETAKEAATVTMILDSNEDVTVAQGKNIILDLNDHVLTGTGKNSVITNNGTLTITDSAENKTTRNWQKAAETGAWTLTEDSSKNTTTGGVITGGTCGVVNNGILALYGGAITGNVSETAGAGVLNNGQLTLGDTIQVIGNRVRLENGYEDNNVQLTAQGKESKMDPSTFTINFKEHAPSEGMKVGLTGYQAATEKENVLVSILRDSKFNPDAYFFADTQQLRIDGDKETGLYIAYAVVKVERSEGFVEYFDDPNCLPDLFASLRDSEAMTLLADCGNEKEPLTLSNDSSVEFTAGLHTLAGSLSGENLTITGGTITGDVTAETITDGTYDGTVTVSGSITGGTYDGTVTVSGSITGGTFNGAVTAGTISDGIFNGTVTAGEISGGTFSGTSSVSNAAISGGTFTGTVTGGSISSGTFSGTVTGSTITDGTFNSSGTVTGATISDGSFSGAVKNCVINNGTFTGTVTGGTINSGTFSGTVTGSTINAGTFSGKVTNAAQISGGTFSKEVTAKKVSGGYYSAKLSVTEGFEMNEGSYAAYFTQAAKEATSPVGKIYFVANDDVTYPWKLADAGENVAILNETTLYNSLQTAVDEAADGDKIRLFTSVNGIIAIPASQSDAAKTITINLNGNTITGTGSGSVITVNGNTATVNTLILTGGSLGKGTVTGGNAANGGGVYVGGNAMLSLTGGVTITGNKATNGGGVYVASNGTLSMTDKASVSNNEATDGGGVYLEQAGKFLSVGLISGNKATNGGGVYVAGNSCTVKGNGQRNWGSIYSNCAVYGGGLYVVENAKLSLEDLEIGARGNGNAAQYGGGVYNAGELTLGRDAYIRNNSAENQGGGVYNAGTLKMNGEYYSAGKRNISGQCSIEYSTAGVDGGGVYNIAGASFTVERGVLNGNKATGNGGGVYNAGEFSFSWGNLNNSEAKDGGAVYAAGGSVVRLTGSADDSHVSLDLNKATGNGGAVYAAAGSSVTIDGYAKTHATTGNSATEKGGAVYAEAGSTVKIDGHASITGNMAPLGGGVYAEGTVILGGSIQIVGNKNGTGKTAAANNLYLPVGKTITLGTGAGEGGNGASAPETGMKVSVMVPTAPTAGQPVTITGEYSTDADYSSYFTSDDSSIKLVYNGYAGTTDDKIVVKLGVSVAKNLATDKEFGSVQDALLAAEYKAYNQTVQMTADSTEEVNIAVGKGVTLDLTGKTLTGSISAPKLALTVKDDAEAGTGTITGNVTSNVSKIQSGRFNGTVSVNEITGGYYVSKPATVKEGYGIFDNEDATYLYTVAPISDSEAMIHPQDNGGDVYYDTLTEAFAAAKTGDTVTLLKDVALSSRVDTAFTGTIDLGGKTITTSDTCANGSAFNVKSGIVTIQNGTIIGIAGPTGQAEPYANECDVITVRSGAEATLENLNISVNSATGSCAYAFAGGKITVNSGTYTNSAEQTGSSGEKAMVFNQANNTDQLITVNGGDFHTGSDPKRGDDSGTPSTFMAEGKTTVAVLNSEKTAIDHYIVAAPVITITSGTVTENYQSLADAYAMAKAGDTITLCKDDSGAGLFIDKDNLTLDLNGKTYTVSGPAVGSSGTQTQGLHIEAANFTLKNGTFTSTAAAESNVKMLVQNYGNLTLDNVDLDGSKISESGKTRYVLSNNSGNVIINNTTITANDGDVALDTCKYGSYTAPTVEVKGSSTINGNIELGGGNLKLTAGTLNGSLKDAGIGDGTVTRAGTFTAEAPEGYGWMKMSDGTYSLIVPVATIGKEAFLSLAAAVEAAADSETIVLQKNIVLTATQVISKAITINLNNYNICGDGVRALWVKAGTLTLNGENDRGNNQVSSINVESKSNSVIRVGEGNSSAAASSGTAGLVVGGNVTIYSDCCYAISAFGSTTETVRIDGTIMTCDKGVAAVTTNGSDMTAASITIGAGAGVCSEKDIAINLPSGNLTVEKGTDSVYPFIGGATALYVKSGNVDIQGGRIIAGGEKTEYSYNGNGSNPTGDAIVVENCGYPNGVPEVTIGADAVLSSDNGMAIGAYCGNGVTEIGKIYSKSSELPVDNSEYAWTKSVNFATNGLYVLGPVVATIGDTGYAKVADAIEAAGTDPTSIVMVKDSDEAGIMLAEGQNITLDLKSYTLTIPSLATYATQPNILTITGSGTITGNVLATRINGGYFTGNVRAKAIAGGYFLDADGVAITENGGITGGCFAVQPKAHTDPSFNPVHADYYVTENDDTATKTEYPLTVVLKPVRTITDEGFVEESQTELPAEVTDKTTKTEIQTEVTAQVQDDISSNTNVSTDSSDIKSKVDGSDLTDLPAKEEAQTYDYDEQLKIVLKSVSSTTTATDADSVNSSTVTTTKAVYDVTPYVTVSTLNADGSVAAIADERPITNAELAAMNATISFRLAVPTTMTGDTVLVEHAADTGTETWTAEVKGSGDNRYVEIESGSFSLFTLSQQTESNSEAKIVRSAKTFLYDSLANAIADAADGETIILLGGEDGIVNEMAAVNGDKTLIIDLNGKTLNGEATGEKAGIAIDKTGEKTLTITDNSTAGTGKLNGVIITEQNNVVLEQAIVDTEPEDDWIALSSTVTANAEDSWTIKKNSAVAMIISGDTKVKYTKLQRALEAATKGGTVYLVADFTENVTINELSTTTLDLNGFTLSGYKPITNKGTLTIVDSSAGQTGTVKGTTYAISTTSGITYIQSGSINGKVVKSDTGKYSITGGVFSCEIADADCAAGYGVVDNNAAETAQTYPYAVAAQSFTIITESFAVDKKSIATVSGGGVYASGSTVTLTASQKDGYIFQGWYLGGTLTDSSYVGGENISSKTEYSFTATADATYVAVYAVNENFTFNLSVNAEAFTLTIGQNTETLPGSVYNKTVTANANVVLTYTGNSDFLYWANEKGNIVSTTPEFSVYMNASKSYTAYVSSDNGEDRSGSTVVFTNNLGQLVSSDYYLKNTAVKYPTQPVYPGHVFNGWLFEDGTRATEEAIANKLGSQTFIVIHADWQNDGDLVNVTVKYEGIECEDSVFSGTANDTIRLTSEATEEQIGELKLSYWKAADGTILSYKDVYKIQCEQDTTVIAVYEDEAEEEQPIISINSFGCEYNESLGKYQFSVKMYFEVPEDCTVTEVGYLYGTDEANVQNASVGSRATNVLKYSTEKTDGLSFFFMTANVRASDTTANFKGYVTYMDDNNNQHVVYSPMISGSYDSLHNAT